MWDKEKNYAWYSSIETMGALDGPGLRLVIFLQGCPLRCLFCHNPETIEWKEDKKITIDEIIAMYRKNESFYKKEGGITISGGEGMGQPDFLINLLEKTIEEDIHVTIDTAVGSYMGRYVEKINKIAELANLFLVDIKHINSDIARELTARGNETQIEFIDYLDSIKKAYWVRHVFVPTYSDRNPNDMYLFGEYIGKLKFMERFEILPYHNMMVAKYEEIKIPFKLGHVEPPSEKDIAGAMKEINRGIKAIRANLN